MTRTLRDKALALLLEPDPARKAGGALALDVDLPIDAAREIGEPPGVPGRPARPLLVPHAQIRPRSVGSVEGRAALVHAIAHIEFNAIDLALDAVWRFAGLPDAYYREWAGVAREEALHFTLLRDHLASLGYAFGDFPAHAALFHRPLESGEPAPYDIDATRSAVRRSAGEPWFRRTSGTSPGKHPTDHAGLPG